MNSVIISAIAGFGRRFGHYFKNSLIYRAVDKIHSAASKSWKNSVIIDKIKGFGGKDAQKKFLIYRIIHFPFSIFEKISEKHCDKIASSAKNSFIFKSMFSFLNSALSLNTKFYAILLISWAIFRQIAVISVSYKLLALIFLGIIAFFTDYNITAFFAESKAVKFLLSVVGFSDLNFDFYDKEKVKKPLALVLAFLIGAISGVLSAKSLMFAVLPFAAVVGAALVLKYPVSGVFFSVFAAPFIPTMLLAALVSYTAVCFIFDALQKRDFKWRIDGVGTGLGLFLIIMLVSSIFSFNARNSILVWGLYLIFVGFYFIIINAVNTRKQLYSIIRIFVIAGLLVSLYGILQYVFGWNTSNAWIDEDMFEDATMRAYSTMGNPNVLGEYLLFVIPLSIFLMLDKGAKWIEKLFWLATAAVCTLCMIFTQSRGCWIGLFAAFAIFITFYNGKLWGLLPLAALALPFVLPQTMIDRFMSVGNLEDSSTSYRVFIWLGSLAMMKDFWIGGIGMGEGAFRTLYPFYSYNTVIAPHSHNLYLQFLVEGGICALLIFAVTLIVYFKKTSVEFSKHGKKSTDGVFALICVSAMEGFMIQSMFDYTFYNYRMMAMFFMIMALSVSLENVKEADSIEGN